MQDARRGSNRKRLHGKVGMSSISVFLLLLPPVPFPLFLPSMVMRLRRAILPPLPFFPYRICTQRRTTETKTEGDPRRDVLYEEE